MRRSSASAVVVEDVFTDGIVNVLEQPEFAEGSKVRAILEVLRRTDFLEQLVPVVTRHGHRALKTEIEHLR